MFVFIVQWQGRGGDWMRYDQEAADRAAKFAGLAMAGNSLQDIARLYGISRQRVQAVLRDILPYARPDMAEELRAYRRKNVMSREAKNDTDIGQHAIQDNGREGGGACG